MATKCSVGGVVVKRCEQLKFLKSCFWCVCETGSRIGVCFSLLGGVLHCLYFCHTMTVGGGAGGGHSGRETPRMKYGERGAECKHRKWRFIWSQLNISSCWALLCSHFMLQPCTALPPTSQSVISASATLHCKTCKWQQTQHVQMNRICVWYVSNV